MKQQLTLHQLNKWQDRLFVDKHLDIWSKDTFKIYSMTYPIHSNMRWDRIGSDNNEDLFRGILCDYSALKEGYQDRIGQGIMFGISTDMTHNQLKHTASYRGIYRTSGKHEAHIVVGISDEDARAVKVIINASTKRVKLSSPVVLDNLWEKQEWEKQEWEKQEIDPLPGTLAMYHQPHGVDWSKYDDTKRANLLFYDGYNWKEVQLGEIKYEE